MITIINLTNGQSVRTSDNSASDIAGLLNANALAGEDSDPNTQPQAIYECTNLDTQSQHHIVTAHIVSVYEQQ